MPHLVEPLHRQRQGWAAGLACGLALSLGAASPGGPAEPATQVASAVPHDRAFWRAVVAADFAVPNGSSAAALVEELSDCRRGARPAQQRHSHRSRSLRRRTQPPGVSCPSAPASDP
ncbi:MAG: hypothetical protein ABJC13_20695 [Acidobacteriota bacterium]